MVLREIATKQSGINYEELVLEDRVHSSIFTRPEIFEEELVKIFNRSWAYIAHASEMPEPGDYVTRIIGRTPVIASRGENGQIHVLVNRCRHRGAAVCQYDSGNSMFFTCPYHGFTYACSGELVGIPRSEAYDESMTEEVKGLVPLPRVDIYRGFIFASLSAEGPSLDEHLGEPCKRMIDIFCDASPMGEIELRAGVQKHAYHGNWKQVGMDGYHPFIVHQSFFEAKSTAAKSGQRTSRRTFTRDLGNGHVMLDLRPGGGTLGALGRAANEPWFPEYLASLERAHGKERAQEIISCGGDPHMHVYPNMQIVDAHIRVMQPVSADETIIYMYPALLKGVPDELNEMRLRIHEDFYGPASGGNPDDYEVFERTQLGMMAEVNPWIILKRGLHTQWREQEEAATLGCIVGDAGDEVTQRGQFKRWKQDMLQP